MSDRDTKGANGTKRSRTSGMGTARLRGETLATRRTAALILEVLAGVRTPTEAAEVLGIAPPRYYVLEARALEGLVHACRPRPRGPNPSPGREVSRLKRELERLQRECDRSAALLRLTERTVGVPAKRSEKKRSSTKTSSSGKKPRKRRPVARALKAVKGLGSLEGDNSLDGTSVTRDHGVEVEK